MNRKFFKTLVIVFFCFMFLPGLAVNAQSGQLKITSVKNNISLFGTNISVAGEANAGQAILVGVKSTKDGFVYSTKTSADSSGNWTVTFNQSLKGGQYNIEAASLGLDGSSVEGAVTYGPVKISGSFAFIVAVFSFLVVILTAGFVGGWYINKLAELKRVRRILISQRDIISSYNVLKNDVDKALKSSNSAETNFLLQRISGNLEKMNKYVAQGVSIIGKYDIITKIDNFFKIKNKKII